MLYEEEHYQTALEAFSNLERKIWLELCFEMYKSVLIWPPGLPPIKTCGLIEGTFREKFYSTYRNALSDFEYEFDNDKGTLNI